MSQSFLHPDEHTFDYCDLISVQTTTTNKQTKAKQHRHGSARRSSLKGRERVIVNQRNIGTVSKVTSGETSDRRGGAQQQQQQQHEPKCREIAFNPLTATACQICWLKTAHINASKQYIWWTYHKSTFNTVHFDSSRFTCTFMRKGENPA